MTISHERLLKLALKSNVLYLFFMILFKLDGLNLWNVLNTFLLVFSITTTVALAIIKIRNVKELTITTKLLFYLIIIWGLVVSIRGFSSNFQDWVTNIGNVYMTPAWLTPLLLVIGMDIKSWNAVHESINLMFKLMVLAFLLYLFSFKDPTEHWLWLLRPVNFIFLVYLYKYTHVKKLYIILILIIYLTIATVTSFRIEYVFLVFVAFLIILDRTSIEDVKLLILKNIIYIFPLIVSYIFLFGYSHFSSLVQTIIEFQDSRTFLFEELFTELNPMEEVVGRGSTGTYFSDFFERTTKYYRLRGNTGWKGDDPNRITIEVGYLEMILKGGYIMFILNFLILIISAYYGIFKSKNRFVKRLGFYILILMVLSIVSFRPAYTPVFIILWISIGTVLNKENRDLTDTEINDIIKTKWKVNHK